MISKCKRRMLFNNLPPEVQILWAKSSKDNSAGYGLLRHMLDVAAVAEQLLGRESETTKAWIAQELGLPCSQVIRWIATLAGLHDFGKAIPGFQNKWEQGKKNGEKVGLTFPPKCLDMKEHDAASANLLRNLLKTKVKNNKWAEDIAGALGAHHGYFFTPEKINKSRPLHEDSIWKDSRGALFKHYWKTLSPQGEPSDLKLKLPVLTWFAGLTSLSDWIGSNKDWFPLDNRCESLEGHFDQSLKLAEIALNEIGWPKFCSLLNEDLPIEKQLERILGQNSPLVPRPLQKVGSKMLSTADGPTLFVVEAPMGEGKTELAFLAYLRLQAVNGHRGLYLALPTQATGNALFDRALTFLRSFSSEVKLDIQLAHGGAQLDERIHLLQGIDNSSDESIASSVWFSQRKRSLLSPYGVGTVDQALLAALNVKHHFVRLWGLANRVVVLDEIHAYDTYTSGLIQELLRWLKAMNCSVVLMSATLPSKTLQAFLQAWEVLDDVSAKVAYPRLIMAQNDQVIAEHVECREMAPIQVLGIEEDLPSIALHAVEKVKQDGCGVVIVNTVQRAQDLYCLLKGYLGTDVELMLFHARFPADERMNREKSVLATFGKSSNLETRPKRALLVATQVVEQSLDIDFDFLVSDLAPVDLLMQRAGRLHRHDRERPQIHRTPSMTVAGLIRDKLPDLEMTSWKYVYSPYVLYRTWAWISRGPVWRLPGDIDLFVQRVYGTEPLPDDLPEGVVNKIEIDAYGEDLANTQEERQRASNAAIAANCELQNAYSSKAWYDDDENGENKRPVTRLGDESITVVPVFVSDDGWRLSPEQNPFNPEKVVSDDLAKSIYLRQVKISRKEIRLALIEEVLPEGFAKNPLLKHLRPMKLTSAGLRISNLQVELNKELGITYKKIKASQEGS